MKLSDNFTLSELIRSKTAQKRGIKNEPNEEIIFALKSLCKNVLQKIRNKVRKQLKQDAVVHVESGYRCKALNKAVGGSKTSQHLVGQAADFWIPNLNIWKTFEYIVTESNINFDKIVGEFLRLDEKGKPQIGWIHVSDRSYKEKNRNIILICFKSNKKNLRGKYKTKYIRYTKQEILDKKYIEDLKKYGKK